MFTSRMTRTIIGTLLATLCVSAPAELIVGCNAASQTNVDCSSIFGGTYTDEGINFFTQTDYHVGYRRGVTSASGFLNESTSVAHLNSFVTSLNDLHTDGASIGNGIDGNTMVVEFDSQVALSGLVLSGLSSFVPRDPTGAEGPIQTETAQVLAFDADGEKIFDRIFEGVNSYVFVDFGNVVPQINTLLISSGGGLPGLTSTNTNIAYLITPLPEPGTVLLFLTGIALIVARRRT